MWSASWITQEYVNKSGLSDALHDTTILFVW